MAHRGSLWSQNPPPHCRPSPLPSKPNFWYQFFCMHPGKSKTRNGGLGKNLSADPLKWEGEGHKRLKVDDSFQPRLVVLFWWCVCVEGKARKTLKGNTASMQRKKDAVVPKEMIYSKQKKYVLIENRERKEPIGGLNHRRGGQNVGCFPLNELGRRRIYFIKVTAGRWSQKKKIGHPEGGVREKSTSPFRHTATPNTTNPKPTPTTNNTGCPRFCQQEDP